MEHFTQAPKRLRLLVCADVDGPSVATMTEHFVPHAPQFDAIIVAGPFIHSATDTQEAKAVAEGEMASIIASFEHIVCRVLYLPSEHDPPDTLLKQLHLTPNSVNIHARRLNLLQNLFLVGFSEKGDRTSRANRTGEDRERSAESDDEMEAVEVASGTSVEAIRELLAASSSPTSTTATSAASATSATNGGAAVGSTGDTELLAGKDQSSYISVKSGIFMLNYRYSHTLNQLLFYMSDDLERADVQLCIISSVDCPETARLPTKFGKLHIAAPQSLRKGGHYIVVGVEFDEASGKWSSISVEPYRLQL